MQNWYVYIIRCADSSLYTGVTTDLERRFNEHLHGKKGAKYFRRTSPLEIAYREPVLNRSEAIRREAEIKALSRPEKLQLIQASTPVRKG